MKRGLLLRIKRDNGSDTKHRPGGRHNARWFIRGDCGDSGENTASLFCDRRRRTYFRDRDRTETEQTYSDSLNDSRKNRIKMRRSTDRCLKYRSLCEKWYNLKIKERVSWKTWFRLIIIYYYIIDIIIDIIIDKLEIRIFIERRKWIERLKFILFLEGYD